MTTPQPCYNGSRTAYTVRRSIMLLSATTSLVLACVGFYDYFFNNAKPCQTHEVPKDSVS